jgi:hypothetical protein
VTAKCNPDGTGCPSGITGKTIPLVASGVLTSAFVNSSTTRTDLAQNAAGNFAGRIEQTTLNAHLRPNQQFGSIMFLSNSADSVYHSLQTTVRKRFGNGLLFNFAYTLSKVIDDQSADPIVTTFTPTSIATLDSTNISRDRARADFDQKHVVVLTWIYELPFGKGQKWGNNAPKFLNALFGGWALQGFNSNSSGQPFSITAGSKTAVYSAATFSRATIVGKTLPDDSLAPKTGVVGPAFFQDTTAFALPAPGDFGMGRNMFNGPWYWDMDGALSKSFQATERIKITFRAEAFNALNHANFRKLSNASVGSGANAANNILSPNFGVACCQSLATSTSTAIVSNGEAYRVAQFVLKVAF